MELKDRISEALRHARKYPTQIAKETGLSDAAISQLMKGKTKALKAENAVSLALATGVRTEWLVTGQGEMVPGNGDGNGQRATTDGCVVQLLRNAASMGAGEDMQDRDILCGEITLKQAFVTKHLHSTRTEGLRFIHAYGDSMEPTLRSGDVLLVDTGIKEVKIDGIYVLAAHDRLFVKRARQRLDGKFEISSDNPTVKTVDVLNGGYEVTVIGKVIYYWNGHNIY